MKIVIKESQYKFLVEQSTTGITPTQTTLTPAENKQKKANAARLAPIEAAQKKRIDNWIADNPGKTEKDYWKMVEKRQSGPDAELPGMEGQGNKKGGSCGAASALQ
jgi:hypothetical protein